MGELSKEELHEIAENAAGSGIHKKWTAKKYLDGIRRLEYSISQKKQEIERLREDAAGIGGMNYDAVRVQTSSSGDKLVMAVASYVDLEKEIHEEIDELIRLRHQIINEIQGLENPDYVNLLYKRYVEYKRLELISVEMNFTYEYTRRMHGRALEEFEKSYTKLHSPVIS